jgi:hypothetical protein
MSLELVAQELQMAFGLRIQLLSGKASPPNLFNSDVCLPGLSGPMLGLGAFGMLEQPTDVGNSSGGEARSLFSEWIQASPRHNLKRVKIKKANLWRLQRTTRVPKHPQK